MHALDIIIVGAGPAGCRAAERLARGGARVALVDGSHPREKPCGGGVTGRALDLVRAAVDGSAMRRVTIDHARFEHGPRTATMTLATGTSGARLEVMSRRDFDGALLRGAREAGATHIAARATGVHREADGWRVVTREGELHGKWLLGADGPNSLVRRRVSAPFERADLSIATGYYVHGASSREITIGFEDHPAGYLWSFPRPDHFAVGVCAQADESSTRMLLPLASRWIERNIVRHCPEVRCERYSWPIPSLRGASIAREQPAGPGWMLLGDAAGLVDPITREGIFFALVSGDLAAASLLEGTEPSRAYEQRLRGVVYEELLRAARLKARFFRPRFTALLVDALQRSAAIRTVMADLIAGEQPYHGLRRRLLGSFEWRLMRELIWRRA